MSSDVMRSSQILFRAKKNVPRPAANLKAAEIANDRPISELVAVVIGPSRYLVSKAYLLNASVLKCR